MLNEFLKEHRKMQEKEATIAELKSTVAKQGGAIAQQRSDSEATITELKKEIETVVARFKEHDAKVQKMCDQVGMSRPASRTVLNDQ